MRLHRLLRFGLFLGSTLAAMAAGAAIATWPHGEEPEGGLEGGDVIARSLASSVQLFAEREGGVRRTASGVTLVAGADGRSYIVTAAHLLTPQGTQTVYVAPLGGGSRVEARILAIDEASDIAVLEAQSVPAAAIRLKTEARLGDNVWVVSFPWGGRGTVVGGAVSQIRSGPEAGFPVSGPVGLIDAAVSYGTSGGGVFDARTGRLVGIVRSYRTAKLALPGTPAQSLELPIAGETSVVPATQILCLLSKIDPEKSAGLAELLTEAPLGGCGDA
jgi:S1-C subfamily serine protease